MGDGQLAASGTCARAAFHHAALSRCRVRSPDRSATEVSTPGGTRNSLEGNPADGDPPEETRANLSPLLPHPPMREITVSRRFTARLVTALRFIGCDGSPTAILLPLSGGESRGPINGPTTEGTLSGAPRRCKQAARFLGALVLCGCPDRSRALSSRPCERRPRSTRTRGAPEKNRTDAFRSS
jgi:hypothetical protein